MDGAEPKVSEGSDSSVLEESESDEWEDYDEWTVHDQLVKWENKFLSIYHRMSAVMTSTIMEMEKVSADAPTSEAARILRERRGKMFELMAELANFKK